MNSRRSKIRMLVSEDMCTRWCVDALNLVEPIIALCNPRCTYVHPPCFKIRLRCIQIVGLDTLLPETDGQWACHNASRSIRIQDLETYDRYFGGISLPPRQAFCRRHFRRVSHRQQRYLYRPILVECRLGRSSFTQDPLMCQEG